MIGIRMFSLKKESHFENYLKFKTFKTDNAMLLLAELKLEQFVNNSNNDKKHDSSIRNKLDLIIRDC